MKIRKETKKSLKANILIDNIGALVYAICLGVLAGFMYSWTGLSGLIVFTLFVVPSVMNMHQLSSQINKLTLEVRELKKQ